MLDSRKHNILRHTQGQVAGRDCSELQTTWVTHNGDLETACGETVAPNAGQCSIIALPNNPEVQDLKTQACQVWRFEFGADDRWVVIGHHWFLYNQRT